jgi:hypothetical protein
VPLPNLKVDGGENHLPYNQVFQLVPEGSTYYVYATLPQKQDPKRSSHICPSYRLNDMFRLNLA